MDKKKLYHPGDLITSFMGEIGIVVSRETLASLRTRFKEGNRPGHYFAPGCCHNPDYITQIPIFFEDGTFDVMRTMNIRKNPDISEDKKHQLRKLKGDIEL